MTSIGATLTADAAQLSAGASTSTANAGDQVSAYRWLIAWIGLIIILMAFSKLKVGYTILYYLAVLTLLFLLVTQYQGIAWVLNPFTDTSQGGS